MDQGVESPCMDLGLQATRNNQRQDFGGGGGLDPSVANLECILRAVGI